MALVIPTLVSERLRLEPFARAHSDGLFELWRHDEVCRHSGSAIDAAGRLISLPARTPADSDRLLDFWLDRARRGTGFRWAVCLGDGGEFVGAVGFNALGPCSEYAYHLVPRHWGRGIASEASGLALDWAFEGGAETVEVFILPENTPSIRLARRLGFDELERVAGEPSRYVVERRRDPAHEREGSARLGARATRSPRNDGA